MEKLSSENKYLLELLEKNFNNLFDLQQKLDCDIINLAEFETRKETLKKDSLRIKKQLLNNLHVGKRGEPLKIPSEPNLTVTGTDYFRVKTNDGKYITAKTYSELIDSLLTHYGYLGIDYSFKAVWECSLKNYRELNPTKDKTYLTLKSDYKRVISADFETKDIRDIKPEDVQKYIQNYLLNLVKRDSNGTIIEQPAKSRYNTLKTVFNMVYEYAITHDEYLINKNPAKYINNRACLALCSTPTKRKTDEVMLTTEQMDSIINLFKERQSESRYKGYYIPYFAAKLQRATGERPGELFAITLDDIKDGYINIHSSMIEHRLSGDEFKLWYEIVDYTKDEKGISNGGRDVPITLEVQEVLHELEEAKRKCGIESKYLIPSMDGDFCKKKVYFDAFTAACKTLNIPTLGSYTFRREYNCRLEEAGLSPAQRSEILGNSELVNQQFYTFARKGTVEHARKAIDDLLKPTNTLSNENVIAFDSVKKTRNLKTKILEL